MDYKDKSDQEIEDEFNTVRGGIGKSFQVVVEHEQRRIKSILPHIQEIPTLKTLQTQYVYLEQLLNTLNGE